jgi:hypothetical protein
VSNSIDYQHYPIFNDIGILIRYRISFDIALLPLLLEASWVRVRVRQSARSSPPSGLTNSENFVKDGEETTAKIATNASHVLTCSFYIS